MRFSHIGNDIEIQRYHLREPGWVLLGYLLVMASTAVVLAFITWVL